MVDSEKVERVRAAQGFFAALDQSGGSTPGALRAYGIADHEYHDDAEMFALMHEMRARILASPAVTSGRVIAAILFQDTLRREMEGRPTASYLWDVKGIVPFLKIDKGLESEANGVRLMKDIPGLESTLDEAVAAGACGTKARSVILDADPKGIAEIVAQQFEIAEVVAAKGLMPILEPEVDIHSPHKAEAEGILKQELSAGLEDTPHSGLLFKLTIPTQPNLYQEFTAHPQLARVLALSGGYERAEADRLLSENHGVIASFSRALTQGLRRDQSEEEFDGLLREAVDEIYEASIT